MKYWLWEELTSNLSLTLGYSPIFHVQKTLIYPFQSLVGNASVHQPLVSLPSGLGLLCVSGRLSKTDGTRRWILPSNRNQTMSVLLWLHERHKQAEQLINLHGWQTTWISHATNSTSPSQVDVPVTAEPVCKHVVWILDCAKTWDFWVKEKFIFIFNVHFVPLALVSSTLPYLFCIHYYICLTWTYLTYTCGDRN